MTDNEYEDVVKAIDRLSYAVIFASIISRKDINITSMNEDVIKNAMKDNFYSED